MAGIFDLIPFIGKGGAMSNIDWVAVGFWTLVIIGLCATGFVLFFLILMRKTFTKTYEIDHQTHRVRRFLGRIKKNKDGVETYTARKLRKSLARPQQKDFFLEGRRDVLFFLKDNNGLHHTLRLPTWKELTKFYKVVYDKDIAPVSNPVNTNPLYDIFFLPNPHENLDWLADKCAESDKEYKDVKWWQHQNVMVIGTAAVCAIMFIMTIVLTRS